MLDGILKKWKKDKSENGLNIITNFNFNKLKATKNLNLKIKNNNKEMNNFKDKMERLKKTCKIYIQTHQVKNKRDTLIMQIFILKYLTQSFRL